MSFCCALPRLGASSERHVLRSPGLKNPSFEFFSFERGIPVLGPGLLRSKLPQKLERLFFGWLCSCSCLKLGFMDSCESHLFSREVGSCSDFSS